MFSASHVSSPTFKWRHIKEVCVGCYKGKIENEGEMAEWLKVLAWKASVEETLPRVRISLSPPKKKMSQDDICHAMAFACVYEK